MQRARKMIWFAVGAALALGGLSASAAGAAVPAPLGTLVAIDYESGEVRSGLARDLSIPQDNVTTPTPPEIVQMETERALYGAYAVRHQTVLGDPGYYGTGQLRSETAYRKSGPTQATVPMFRSYQFSFSLDDWEYWVANPTAGVPDGPGIYGSDLRSVLWQFKRTQASPVEAYFSVRANRLDFDWGGGGPNHTVLPDLRPYDAQWIDIRIDVQWAQDATGSYVVGVRTPDQADYTTVVELRGIPTWRSAPGGGDVGVIQWGDFRSNSSNATLVRMKNAPLLRAVLHDEIRIGDRRLPAPIRPVKPTVSDERVTVSAGAVATLPAASDDTTASPATIELASTRFTAPSAAVGGRELAAAGEGTWRLQPDGTATFTPEAGFVGTTTAVQYLVRGSDGGGALASLSVTVDAPVVTPTPTPEPTAPPTPTPTPTASPGTVDPTPPAATDAGAGTAPASTATAGTTSTGTPLAATGAEPPLIALASGGLLAIVGVWLLIRRRRTS